MRSDAQQFVRIRWILTLAALSCLLYGLYSVLRPFIVPSAWAAILVLTTFPLYKRVLRTFGGRRVAASLFMTLVLAVVLLAAVVPLLTAAAKELESFVTDMTQWSDESSHGLATKITAIPFVGAMVADALDEHLASAQSLGQELGQLLKENRSELLQFATIAARNLAEALFKIVMCLFISFFFFLHGATLTNQLTRALRRLGGERFERLLSATRETVRGAVYGVLATALAQGILAGIGFAIAGAPVPLLLMFATMVFSLVPFGTPLVYTPVAIYLLFSADSWIPGVLLLAYGISIVSTIDNVLRPLFISQATQMPLLLVFMGVIGGIVSFGLLGIFIGPVLLAVGLVLWDEWVAHPPGEAQAHSRSSA